MLIKKNKQLATLRKAKKNYQHYFHAAFNTFLEITYTLTSFPDKLIMFLAKVYFSLVKHLQRNLMAMSFGHKYSSSFFHLPKSVKMPKITQICLEVFNKGKIYFSQNCCQFVRESCAGIDHF